MSYVIQSGNLPRYIGGPFASGTWKPTYIEILTDGTIRWFEQKGDMYPLNSVNLRCVSSYIAMGRVIECVPCRPTDVTQTDIERMFGIPHENEKTTPVTFFRCNGEQEMKTWCDAIMNVLQAPAAPPQPMGSMGLQIPMSNMGQRQNSAPNLSQMPPYPGAPPPYVPSGAPPYPPSGTPSYHPSASGVFPSPQAGFAPPAGVSPYPVQSGYPTNPAVPYPNYVRQPYPQVTQYPQYPQYQASTSQGISVQPQPVVYVQGPKMKKNKGLKKGVMGVAAGAAGLYMAHKVGSALNPFHHHHGFYGGGWGHGFGHHGSWSWSSGSWSS